VTGFYEWTGATRSKVPHVIRVRGAAVDPDRGERLDHEASEEETVEPFLLAGIAEGWAAPDGALVRTFTIITTEPNELCAPIHDRMPAILEGDDARSWLEAPAEAAEPLVDLLRPFPAERMEHWPVSRAVNDARRDGPDLAAPELTL
jgi:putative SOS response-associated peptidase YedK